MHGLLHFIFPTIISKLRKGHVKEIALIFASSCHQRELLISCVIIKRELEKVAKGFHIIGIRFSAPIQLKVYFIHAHRGAVK